MKIPLGSRIQGLEKTVVENLNATDIVQHAHFYNRDLKSRDEPLVLSYKVPSHFKGHDPFFEIFPLTQILNRRYGGVIEVTSGYDPKTEVRTLKFKLQYCPDNDALKFKYEVLQEINSAVCSYLRRRGVKCIKR